MTAIALDRSSRFSLTVLMFGIAAVGIQALMLSPVLPDIAAALRAGAREVGIASGAYGAGVAIAALLAAPRLGQWSKRQAIQYAFAVMAAGLALCAMAQDWRILAAGQFIAGGAAGVIIPGIYAFAAELSDSEMRSRAVGKVLLGWSVAMVAGIPFAAFLADFFGWRLTFVTVAVIAAAMVAGIGLLPRAETDATARPVSYGRALAVRGIPLTLIATFAYMIAFYQTYTFIGDHVRHLHGAGAWLGGLIACSYGAGFGAAMAFDGWIDRTGAGRLMPLGLFLVGLVYAVLPASTLWIATAIGFPFLWGLANHLCMNTLVSYIGGAPPAERATAMGLFSFITYVAVGLGGAVYGSVYTAFGFAVVSFAATAGLWIAAGLVLIVLPRKAGA
jgi:predicted MFS family arabinose efflux permease